MVTYQTVAMTQPVVICNNRSKDFLKTLTVIIINIFAAIST
ncbi:hypothetical protein SAMN05421882_10806 [Nitrosomonas communis]|uniref:Uncharacterized protein n=1 Tax=Nitrosomonas communis TaxID=44574 RepID=A0A1H2ZJU9_9PROT|nr:hypothetical protein SAMN05421882_10806 [Nitrosomonas communis]